MIDLRFWQEQAPGESVEPASVHAPILLASPLQAIEPDTPDLMTELVEK
jgi:hypothetical protein